MLNVRMRLNDGPDIRTEQSFMKHHAVYYNRTKSTRLGYARGREVQERCLVNVPTTALTAGAPMGTLTARYNLDPGIPSIIHGDRYADEDVHIERADVEDSCTMPLEILMDTMPKRPICMSM